MHKNQNGYTNKLFQITLKTGVCRYQCRIKKITGSIELQSTY